MVYGILATVVCVILAILLHLIILQILWRYGKPRVRSATGIGVAVMVLGCIIGHLLEIGVFSVGLFITAALDGDAKLALEAFNANHLDLWYYSATLYTSLVADRPQTAALRVFTACETVTGLILITWTASFLFLVMQKFWSLVEDKRG